MGMDVKARFLSEPRLRNPFLIGGLPGIGYVGKVCADYLVQELKGELFCELYSKFFPPYVLVKKDGTVELMKNELYYCRNDQSDHDIVVFTGNTQALSAEGQYAIAEEVLNISVKMDIKTLYTLAAFATSQPVEKPRVLGAATNVEILKEAQKFNVIPLEEGSISGINGLLFGLAKLKNIRGLCLLGETPGYTTPTGRSIVDAKSAQAVLEVLTRMLSIKINLEPLQTQAKLTEEFIHKMEEMERSVLDEMSKKSGMKEQTYYI